MRAPLHVLLPWMVVLAPPAWLGAQPRTAADDVGVPVGPTRAGLVVGAATVRRDAPPLVTVVRTRAPDRPAPAASFAVRVVTGTLGAVVGGVGGAVVGSSAFGTSGGDDPGLHEAIIGAAMGAALGAGLGAAIPGRGSECTFIHRVGLGLVGGAAGALVGALPGRRSSVVLITVPLGSAAGAAGALGAASC